MKTWNRTLSGGQAMRHQARSAGRSSPNGSGICASNWAISFILTQCAPPSLLLHTPGCMIRLLTRLLPHRGMGQQKWPIPGNKAASRVKTLPSNRMERCAVRQASRCLQTSGAEKPMGACAWSMRPASAVVVPVPCANSVNGMAALPPSRALVSVLLHPLVVGSAPLLWRDWSRRYYRRACLQLLRHQCVEVEVGPPTCASLAVTPAPLSRAQRAHSRLSWAERLARNARPLTAGRVTIRLFGIPEGFAISLALATA